MTKTPKDNSLKCGGTCCDGGMQCKEDNSPALAVCRKCLCFSCVKGECRKEA